MLSGHAFLIYCGIYAVFIAIPGPGIVSVVARAMGGGFSAAVPATLGILVSHFGMVTLSACGLAAIARGLGEAFLFVKLAGGAYLIWLGTRYWFAPTTAEWKDSPETPWQSFVAQLSFSLGNPKVLAFFVGLLPAVVDLPHLNAIGYLQLLAACALVMPPIILSYAAFAARLRGVLVNKKSRARMNKGAGIIMVGAGIGVAAS